MAITLTRFLPPLIGLAVLGTGIAWGVQHGVGRVLGEQVIVAPAASAAPVGDTFTFTRGASPWIGPIGPAGSVETVTAAAYIAVDETTGRVLAAHNERERRPMASLTKMMTAALAAEFLDPQTAVTIQPSAVADLPADSAIMGVQVGETYTVGELLDGLLLPSGNDAANALAEATAGSQARFVAMMNAKAKQLGLNDTAFANPSGLDAEGHYTTAYDLAVLAHYFRSFPLLVEAAGTREVYLPASTMHGPLNLVNLNPFLDMYPGATGLKPGYTGNAGHCLAASAIVAGRPLVGIILDTPGRNTNMIKLFDGVADR